MPYRFINIGMDNVSTLKLNVISGGALVLETACDVLSSTTGIILTLSIAILNISKAYLNFRKAKKEIKSSKIDNSENEG